MLGWGIRFTCDCMFVHLLSSFVYFFSFLFFSFVIVPLPRAFEFTFFLLRAVQYISSSAHELLVFTFDVIIRLD